MLKLERGFFWFAIVLVLLSTGACHKNRVAVAGKGREGSSGLQAGINYMQPMRWRVTYNYRVQDITPRVRFISPRAMPDFPGIIAVGSGNYEVWFTGPREGEGVRDVKLVNAIPAPSSISEGSETEPVFYYYNFSPGGQLPDQISASLTWEFTTFERYTHWKGMQVGEYDKQSELFQKYTKEEDPIDFDGNMVNVALNIQKEAKGDPVKTAMGCYNYIVANFEYDQSQEDKSKYMGLEAMVNASRSWENKHGICDEFATVFCAMTRSVGIPSRPVAGFSHGSMLWTDEDTDKHVRTLFARVEKKYGPYLQPGGHAWAEYYLPDVGWVPVDPTWGGERDLPVPMYLSRMGSNRDIGMGDYYYGKMDPLRIALYKDWNYTLDPAPVSRGASPVQDWMLGYTERTNGVLEMIHGWEGVKSKKNPKYCADGFFRSAESAGRNFQIGVEALGPASSDQVAAIIKEIEEEGDHYIRIPKIKGSWPMATCGEGFQDTLDEMNENIAKELPKRENQKKLLRDKVRDFFNSV